MKNTRIPAPASAADINRVVAEARAARARVIRATAVEMNAAMKRFFGGFHRPAPRKSATA